jgi:hypothetical protein
MDPEVNRKMRTCKTSALDSGLITPFFSGIKDGVETEGEERPKRVGGAAKARELGRAGVVEMRRVWGKRRRLLVLLSTLSPSSSSSSKKELLGSTSGK